MTYSFSNSEGLELYKALEPLTLEDEANGSGMAKLLDAIAAMHQEVADLAQDTVDEDPGWSIVLDAQRVPAKALSWLGQFVGVTAQELLPLNEAGQRAMLRTRPKFARGTPLALVAAVQATLTGEKTVFLRERYGGAWKLSVRTITGQTPDQAKTVAAILTQKPAGITLDYAAVVGQDYQDVLDNNTDYADLLATYDTYNDVLTDLP